MYLSVADWDERLKGFILVVVVKERGGGAEAELSRGSWGRVDEIKAEAREKRKAGRLVVRNRMRILCLAFNRNPSW